jgi:hypothetical protein
VVIGLQEQRAYQHINPSNYPKKRTDRHQLDGLASFLAMAFLYASKDSCFVTEPFAINSTA